MAENKLPKVGVGIMVIKDDQVLLGKRRGGTYDGFYAFPGGGLEWFEDLIACGKREIIEECGEDLVVSEPEFFYVHNLIDRDRQKHFLAITLATKWQAGEPVVVEPDKCFSWEWFLLTALPENILPNNYQAVQKWLKLEQKKV